MPVLAEVHRLDRYPLNWPHDPIRWLFPHNTAHAWVAETAGGAVVGHVAVHRLPSTTDSTLLATVEASRLFVAPGARGHGLGAELLGHARLWAAEHRCSLTLDIVDDQRSAAAIALYERTGWKQLTSARQASSEVRHSRAHRVSDSG